MITIFASPRPFKGQFDIIQRNAIKSWLMLESGCEVILSDDEEGSTASFASEIGISCINVKYNEYGKPILSDLFEKIKNKAKYDIVAYLNADIILLNDFVNAVANVVKCTRGGPFLMVGQRNDVDLREPINFKQGWEKELRKKVKKDGSLHGLSGMDYWVFPRDVDFNDSPFFVGCPGMDSWLVFRARSLKIPVIDATECVTVVHQNHDYPNRKSSDFEKEMKRAINLAGGSSCMFSLRDANWLLGSEGLKRPGFPRNLYARLSLCYSWRLLLSIKRNRQAQR